MSLLRGHPGGCAGPGAGCGSLGNAGDAAAAAAVTRSPCYSRQRFGFSLFVYFEKKEGTFSLSFAQSFPFTVGKTTELDAKAGAVGTSAER